MSAVLPIYKLKYVMNNLPLAFDGFVKQNIDLVVRSPPKGNDLNSLNGTWTKWFITTTEILNVSPWICGLSGIAGIKLDAPDWNSIIEMRYKELITVKCRKNKYLLYENKIIGNQLLKNQENRLASHKSNLQNENFATIDEKEINASQKELSPEIVDYDGLVSKSIAPDSNNPFCFALCLSKQDR
ncbi:4322_t:CDS:2 [Cetraspora pellucida]|uniref:4322_t:CDS:1 n=1 Tax=Cetraspora pellucida TaxID=1433469 RepID=A0A9N9CUQ5_9GLOM|nr:4322_t:CDS:2 [Cetraspora pellucida]